MRTVRRAIAAGLAGVALCAGAHARTLAPVATPVVAIVIDDLGNLRDEGLRAVELPGPVTYAVLPYTPHGPALARLAHALDKEVIVHLPMEATSRHALGPGGLTAALTRHQFEVRAVAAFNSVPYASGVSNHMGSLLTTLNRPMAWLMQLVSARRHWLFLDSRTTARTVAESTAHAAGVPSTYRDVFLDNVVNALAIQDRFAELVATARANGTAVAIGHPHPQTLGVLRRELPRLSRQGVKLVSLSALVARRFRQPVQVAQSSPARGQAASTR